MLGIFSEYCLLIIILPRNYCQSKFTNSKKINPNEQQDLLSPIFGGTFTYFPVTKLAVANCNLCITVSVNTVGAPRIIVERIKIFK
jgi:hypothetical protein